MNTQIKQSIKRAGGVAAVAAHLDITPVSVYEWIKRNRVPADKCPEIEKFSGGAVRCEDLNDEVDWPFIRSTAANPPTPTPAPACSPAKESA